MIPAYKRNRNITPARLSLTAHGGAVCQLENRSHVPEISGKEIIPEGSQATDSVPPGLEEGFPQKQFRHGPGFSVLKDLERKELVRLHNNLGHPYPKVFAKFLSKRKAEGNAGNGRFTRIIEEATLYHQTIAIYPRRAVQCTHGYMVQRGRSMSDIVHWPSRRVY